MAKGKKHHKRGRQSGRAPRNTTVALVVVDGSARRKKERALYRRCATQLERETQKLKVFEEQDVPQFARWIESDFADELLQLRQATARIADLEHLESQVRTLASLRRLPLWQAHREVDAARKDGTIDNIITTVGRSTDQGKALAW